MTLSPPVLVPENNPGHELESLGNRDRVAAALLPEPGREAAELWGWGWLLWENRRLLLRALIWGLAISLLAAFILPKRYCSTTRLMPPDGQSGSSLAMLAAMAGKGGLGMGSLAGGLLGMKSSGTLFIEILRSRTVEDRIVRRFDLRKVYRDRYWVDARRHLAGYTEIAQNRKSDVITIEATDRDPGRAARIAQAYVEELDRLVAEVSTSSARRERVFIEQRLSGVKRELDRASEEFSQFASRNATLDIGSQGSAMVEAASRVQGELIASQSEMESLQQMYATGNVRVRSLRARIEELNRQLDKLDGDWPAPVLTQASAHQKFPQSGVPGSPFPSIRQLPLLGVRWAELYRQCKMEEAVYEMLTQQYELAKIEEAKEIPTVKILDAADIAEKRATPRRAQIMLLGGLFSLIGGAAWVILCNLWNRAGPGDARKLLAQSIARYALACQPFHWLQTYRGLSSAARTSTPGRA